MSSTNHKPSHPVTARHSRASLPRSAAFCGHLICSEDSDKCYLHPSAIGTTLHHVHCVRCCDHIIQDFTDIVLCMICTYGSMTKRTRAERRRFRLQHNSHIVLQYKSDIVARFSRHGKKKIVPRYEVCCVCLVALVICCWNALWRFWVLGLGWVGQFLM